MNKFVGTIMIVFVALAFQACKDKPTSKPQKPVTKVVTKPVKKDTAAIDSLKKIAEAKKVVKKEVSKPADKYFLIAGSFQSRRNADIFKGRLEKEGYASTVIERRTGPNADFFKVSYKGFHDRKMAYAELRKARNSEGRDNVWLLIKK